MNYFNSLLVPPDSQIKGELQLTICVQNFTSIRKNEKKENN